MQDQLDTETAQGKANLLRLVTELGIRPRSAEHLVVETEKIASFLFSSDSLVTLDKATEALSRELKSDRDRAQSPPGPQSPDTVADESTESGDTPTHVNGSRHSSRPTMLASGTVSRLVADSVTIRVSGPVKFILCRLNDVVLDLEYPTSSVSLESSYARKLSVTGDPHAVAIFRAQFPGVPVVDKPGDPL